MKSEKQNIEAVPAAEFTRNFGVYRVRAERKAVAVSSHGRITGYFVAADEYERLKRRDREALKLTDIDDDTLEVIANTQMDARHDHLDDLLPLNWKP